MSSGPLFDEDLIRRLPLPLAQLYRRADNAVEPLKRHLAAFDLWEAALMLLASTAIVEYAEGTEFDPALADKLKNLARPQLGQWWDFVRSLIPILAERGDEPFRQLEALLWDQLETTFPVRPASTPPFWTCSARRKKAQAAVRLKDLFDHLVTYRNKVLAHAAPGQLPDDLNERMARTLLSGLGQLLGRLDFLAGRRLLYVASVHPEAGRWIIDRFELKGENARHLEPLEVPRTAKDHMPVDGKRLYLEVTGASQPAGSMKELARMRLLHPLVTYEPQSQQVYFLCGRPSEKRTDYLCYMTGRHEERPDLGNEQRELLARVLKMPVNDAQLHQWADAPTEESQPEPEQPAPAQGPRTVGEFQLLSKLGEGGMGVVYRAWQPSLRRQVALKVLSGMGEKAEARFHREIQALGRVDHAHIVKVFTSGSDGDLWFYAMELVEGVPLSMICDQLESQTTNAAQVDLQTWQGALSTACAESRRSEKPLSNPPAPPHKVPNVASEAGSAPPPLAGGRDYPRQIARLIVQVAEGAHALHEANVIHRDIKPGNIIVAANGTQAVLVDLGVAQLADDIDGRLTRTRQVVGTLRYASPQQVLAVGKLDRRTDIYSLGVTLWELLTLRPFLDATDDMPEPVLMEKIQHEEPKSVRGYHPRIARDLEAIVQKCLEKDPKRRYATASDLADDLNRFLSGEAVVARPVGMLRRRYRWAKRRPLRVLAAAAAVIALAGAAFGYRYWDAHFRTKTEYYANIIMKRGAAVGVGRLDEARARNRGVSWKFTKRGGRVERIDAVNGLAYLTTEHRQEAYFHRTDETKRECSYVYRRDGEGNVEEEIALDRQGQVVWTFHFSTPTTGYYADKRGIARARSGSGAAYVEIEYDEAGLEHVVRFLDRSGNPQGDIDGIFGYRREFDARGLEVGVAYLDIAGNPTLSKYGYAQTRNSRDDFGNSLDTDYLGVDGHPVVINDGYAKLVRKYDEAGNQIDVAFLGLDGKPALARDGNARRTNRFDDRGNEIERAFFGIDGAPVVINEGYAKVIRKFDERGNKIEVVFLGVDGKPALYKLGYSRWTAAYDENGNQTETNYFGLDGKPALHKDGYATMTSTYDGRGNETARAFFGVDGKPVAIKEGYAKWTALYDEQGNLTEKAYFGVAGKPALQSDGYARWIKKYDDRGNPTETRYFGVDGKPTLHKSGYAIDTTKYDDRGYAIEATALGLDGKPVTIDIGIARVVMKYDNRGYKIETAAYGPDGNPIASSSGYARSVVQYDDRGHQTEIIYYGADGKRLLTPDGYAKWTRKYDDRGNEIESAFFGLDDRPISIKDGFAKEVTIYDNRGNRMERAFFGVDGRPVREKVGDAKWKRKYDDRGNIVERAFFGVRDEPVLIVDGYAKSKSKFDERSNEIETTTFGVDDKPIASTDGYAIQVCKFDNRGNRTASAYYAADGRPTLETAGDAGWTAQYDERGHQTERIYLGLEGKPRTVKAGYAKVVRDYDDRGYEIATAYFAPDGQPARAQNGCTRMTTAYDSRGIRIAQTFFGVDPAKGYAVLSRKSDARGNTLEESYFDDGGKPILVKNGFARIAYEYDERNHPIKIETFGVDGKPALNKNGFAKVVAAYDDRGNQVEFAYFGVDGRPTRDVRGFWKTNLVYNETGKRIGQTWWGLNGSDGYQTISKRFDDRGRLIEEAYRDLAGAPVTVKDGFARIARSYHDRGTLLPSNSHEKGNEVETRYFAADGKPALRIDGNGYAKWIAEYDEHANEVESAYFGLDDKPARTALGCARMLCKYDERGHMTEESFFGADGLPILINTGCAKWAARFDGRGNEIERAYFGLDGKPIANKNGFAKIVTAYDRNATAIKNSYFDSRDKPITIEVVAVEIVPGSQASKLGVKPKDVLHRYDGEAVTDMASFIYGRQSERPGDKPRELQLLRQGSIVAVTVTPGRLGISLRDNCRPPAKTPDANPAKTPTKPPTAEKPPAAAHAAKK